MGTYVDIDGHATWVEERGSGEETVLLLHGGLSDSSLLLDSMGETNLKTIAGTVDFTKPVVPHITKTPLVGGQWVDSQKWDVEFKIVTNTEFPQIPTDGKLQPMNA